MQLYDYEAANAIKTLAAVATPLAATSRLQTMEIDQSHQEMLWENHAPLIFAMQP